MNQFDKLSQVDPSEDVRRYLVVGPSWIGDMVMAQSLFITLKRQYPACEIDVLAPQWSLPVLNRMPEVHRGIPTDLGHGEFSLVRRYRLGRSLREERYSHAIVLPRSWKSALVPFFAAVPIRTGFRGEMRYGLLNDIRELDKSRLVQTVQRYVSHAYPDESEELDIPFPRLEVDRSNQKALLSRSGLSLDKPVVCMMPGAEYGPAKQWPIDHYAALATALATRGYQVWVLGSDKDVAAGDRIANGSPDRYNLCGKTELVDTVDLLACASAVVTNDSGLMHVAAAVGVDVNVIYGSSTPDYTPPLTDDEKRHVFYLGLECSPCFQRTCRFGHYDCLNDISVNDVFESVFRKD